MGWAASTSSAIYGGTVLTAATMGRHAFIGLTNAAWPAAAVLLAGAAVAAATLAAPPQRASWRMVSAALWTVAGLALAGSCWVLLSLIELILTGTVRDRDGNSDWLAFSERLSLAVVGALFMATAVAWQRRGAKACPRCGTTHPPMTSTRRHPEPRAASPRVRLIACAGAAAFVPYLVLHALGAAGVAGIEPDGFRPPWQAIAGGVLAVGLAVFLLFGLVRPWGMVFPRWTLWLAGRRVPRFLPLTPVWLIAPTLALYGTGSLGYAFFTEYGVVSLGGAASIAFGGYGWALGIAAVSYQIRTRPSCAPRPSTADAR